MMTIVPLLVLQLCWTGLLDHQWRAPVTHYVPVIEWARPMETGQAPQVVRRSRLEMWQAAWRASQRKE